MPGKHLTIRSLTMPVMPQEELVEAMRWEAKRYISYPLDAAIVDYLVTGERREKPVAKYEMVLIAAERKTVTEFLAPFQEAGVKIAVVDANPLAIRNVLRLRPKPEQRNALVIDMGAGKTEIDIFQDGALRFSRCLESGGIEMTRAIAARRDGAP
jgi:type IV pilus assembly protein PilM